MDSDAWSVIFKAAIRIVVVVVIGVVALAFGIGCLIGHHG